MTGPAASFYFSQVTASAKGLQLRRRIVPLVRGHRCRVAVMKEPRGETHLLEFRLGRTLFRLETATDSLSCSGNRHSNAEVTMSPTRWRQCRPKWAIMAALNTIRGGRKWKRPFGRSCVCLTSTVKRQACSRDMTKEASRGSHGKSSAEVVAGGGKPCPQRADDRAGLFFG